MQQRSRATPTFGRTLLERNAARRLDSLGEERGFPVELLMEVAGSQAARVLTADYTHLLSAPLILGGPGHNGGDAWVVARHLLVAGIEPRIFLLGNPQQLTGAARANWQRLEQLAPARVPDNQIEHACKESSLLVDGLFGTGLSRSLRDHAAAVVDAINCSGAPCIALDVPSGIDADTGQVLGAAVRARATLTFAAPKVGLMQLPGAEHSGLVHTLSIGIPASWANSQLRAIAPSDAHQALAPRAPGLHKGGAGRVLVVGGAPGRRGAVELAGLAALRTGAGLVTVACPSALPEIQLRHAELMAVRLPILKDLEGPSEPIKPGSLREPTEPTNPRNAQGSQNAQGLQTAESQLLDKLYAVIETSAAAAQAVVLGPGLGTGALASALVHRAATQLDRPMVLDADALTVLAAHPEILRGAPKSRILTPHPGEASRLLQCSTQAIQADRVGAARRLVELTEQTVVLKGAYTVCASPARNLWISSHANPALATGGTGDVLAGAIASLLCTRSADEAGWLGVELHALAGKQAALSDRGMLASEVANAIPVVYAALLQATPP